MAQTGPVRGGRARESEPRQPRASRRSPVPRLAGLRPLEGALRVILPHFTEEVKSAARPQRRRGVQPAGRGVVTCLLHTGMNHGCCRDAAGQRGQRPLCVGMCLCLHTLSRVIRGVPAKTLSWTCPCFQSHCAVRREGLLANPVPVRQGQRVNLNFVTFGLGYFQGMTSTCSQKISKRKLGTNF